MKSCVTDYPLIDGLRDLQEKLARLRSITSDDHFISSLRDLQEHLALLRSIKIEKEKPHAVSIVKVAFPPKGRIIPTRRVIVPLGAVVGMLSGIFLSFFIGFMQNQKKKHSD